jgi:transcriptional regulator of acetoin/glycerol metabolism
MATQNTQQKKTALLEALEKSLGVVTTACKQVGIARKTYYLWIAKDKDFKDAVDDIS